MSKRLSMLIFAFIVFSLFLFVLQNTLFAELPAWLGRPDLIFLLVVFLAYRFEAIKGAVLVFLIGLFMDIFSGIFFNMDSRQSDFFCTSSVGDFYVSLFTEGKFILAYLVSLWEVGVEVIFSCEPAG